MAPEIATEQLTKDLSATRSPDKKIELLLNACREIQYNKPLEALEFAEQARAIARKAKLKAREVHCLRMGGICKFAQHDYEGALNAFQESMRMYQRLKDGTGKAKAHQNIGMAFRALGKTDEAITEYRQAEKIARDKADKPLLMTVLNNLGSLYSVLDKPKEALESFAECLSIAERTDDAILRARLTGNIADLYANLGDDETGLKWSQKSLQLHRANSDSMGIALTLSNLGRIHQGRGALDEALAVLTEALTVTSKLNDKHSSARIMMVLSRVFLEKKMVTQAQAMALEAAEVFKQSNDVEREIACLITLAVIARKQNRHADSVKILANAFALSKKTDNPVLFVDIERNLAALAISKKDLATALKHLRKAVKIAADHSMHGTTAELYREIADVQSKMSNWKAAAESERLASESQRSADNEIRASHAKALQLQLDVERLARERERIESNNERLAFELESKEREMNSQALAIAQKNELLTDLATDVTKVIEASQTERLGLAKDVLRRIENHRRFGEDWRNLSEQLAEVHDDFLRNLSALCPSLTSTEIKMASLLKLNLSSKQMAELLTVSVQSVEVYRYRLRKKLNIPQSVSLTTFMQRIGT